MNRKIVNLVTAALAGLALSACGMLDGVVGGGKKQSPDEFRVVSHTPLTMPPNADLRPPRPGATRPGDQTPQAVARAALQPPPAPAGRGGRPPAATVATGSQAETALLARAGQAGADPNIRLQVDRDSRLLADSDRTFIDSLIFWRDAPQPGTLLDPAAEQARLRAAQAQGTDPSGATPKIERRRRGLLEGIF